MSTDEISLVAESRREVDAVKLIEFVLTVIKPEIPLSANNATDTRMAAQLYLMWRKQNEQNLRDGCKVCSFHILLY